MSKKLMQFRYYDIKNDEPNSKNYPQTITKGNLADGSIFRDFRPIIQLGIQTLPGTEFFINNSTTPIIIGSTGIYELSLEGMTQITDLKFSPKSIDSIDQNPVGYLIIDVIYDNELVQEG